MGGSKDIGGPDLCGSNGGGVSSQLPVYDFLKILKSYTACGTANSACRRGRLAARQGRVVDEGDGEICTGGTGSGWGVWFG